MRGCMYNTEKYSDNTVFCFCGINKKISFALKQ